jgi:pimeloyl-ACP methyl ester carboxylesterase
MKQFRRGHLVFDLHDSGPADGPAVVLLHGHPQTSAAWDSVIPRLTERGYRCLAPNQRGYSRGARPERRRDYRTAELTGDVGALVDAIGVQDVHLVGHDWGALVAWGFAAEQPQRLKTLSVLSGPHPTALQVAMMTSRQGLASWYAYAYLVPRLPEWFYLGRDGKGSRLARMLQAGGQSPELARRDALAMSEAGAYTAALNWYRAVPWSGVTGRVSVPTMAIWGDGDKYILDRAVRRTARYVSGEYRFEVLHGASHWMPDQQPDQIADLLLDWFARHSSPAAT